MFTEILCRIQLRINHTDKVALKFLGNFSIEHSTKTIFNMKITLIIHSNISLICKFKNIIQNSQCWTFFRIYN